MKKHNSSFLATKTFFLSLIFFAIFLISLVHTGDFPELTVISGLFAMGMLMLSRLISRFY